MSIDPATHHIRRLDDEIGKLKSRMERMMRFGTIPAHGGTDYSDPEKPRVRIQHGINADGTPALGPWLPQMHHAGEKSTWTPATPGQQFMQICPDGVLENGYCIPLGHSKKVPAPSTDPNRHVSQFGDHREDEGKQDHTRTIGGTSVHQDTKDHKVNVPGQIEHTAGDPAAAASSGAGALQNFPHELNRQNQGFAARLDQHDHHLTAIHDQLSTVVDKLVGLCPALLDQQQMTLNHKADGLKKAADQAQGMLPEYSASAIEQTVSKLLGGSPLGAVREAKQADIAGQITPLLGQLGGMLGAAGLSPAQTNTAAMLMNTAQGAVAAAAAGGPYALMGALSSIAGLVKGTPGEGMVGDVVGKITSSVGDTSSLMGGLMGLLDGQVNATKGTIKSVLLGGYG